MIIREALKYSAILSVLFLLTVSSFAQVDVPRETLAITYPIHERITVRFRGTTRFPRMSGSAKIRRTRKNGTEIKLSVSKMPRPFELGAGYATYVLWAVSPTGQVDNLGEIKRRGFLWFNSNITVTTPLQTFALIVTAEPHILDSRPSKEIMLENLRPFSSSKRSVATTNTIQYFGNSSDYFKDARTPRIAEINYRRTPPSVLQAKQAVALAKFAGADRDAPKELQQAITYLNNAENGWKAGRGEKYVDIAARKSISTAVSAERTASIRRAAREKRNQKIRQDAELRTAEDRYTDALRRIDSLKTALSDETRSRELSERDVENYLKQIRDLKADNQRLRNEAQDAKIKLAASETKQKAYEAEKDRSQKLRNLENGVPILTQSLERFGHVNKTGNRITLTLAENYWSGVRVSSFASATDTKLAGLAETLKSSPAYNIVIESHIDNKGEVGDLQVLTDERAQAIADKMMSLGIPANRMRVKGYGPSLPIAPNSTWANRSKNRRVYLILVPNI